MVTVIQLVALACIVALSDASCPLTRMSRRADQPSDPAMQRALEEASKGEFCGAPLCEPMAGGKRRLLSGATVGSNGFPTLEQSTVDAIEAAFCTVVDGTRTNDRNGACSVTTGLDNRERASETRSDITAGAIQLAFHDAGTWDPSATSKGGADGCACDKFGPNKGLDYIKDVLAPIYDQYKNYLSLADFWVICANAAIKSSVAAEDAPLTVGFKYGRSDIDCSDCDATVAARLPDESKSTDHVEEVFVTRMGLTKAETVALMGAHSMGKMEPLNTGYAGKWDRTFAQLDNLYFDQILNKPWVRFSVDETTVFNDPDQGAHAPYPDYVHEQTKHEWRVRPGGDTFQDDTDKLLNTDMCLAWNIGDDDNVNEGTCTTRPSNAATVAADTRRGECGSQDASWRAHVITYAADNSKFLTDFAAAWQKLVELQPNTLVEVGTAQSGAAPTAATTSAPTTAATTATTSAPTTAATTATTSAPTTAPTRRRPTRGSRMVDAEDSWEEA